MWECSGWKFHPGGNIWNTTCLGFWMWAMWCSTGKILISGDLIIWRDSAECGDGKDWDRLICDEELAWVWELDEESFDIVCDFRLGAVTVCA